MLAPEHIQALGLTFKLAALTASCLLCLCIPLAWWLSRKKSLLRDVINVLSALPIVLPATVLGFYLLVVLGPSGLDLAFLLFSFEGLLFASIIYSFPFVLQPIQQAFVAVPDKVLKTAATLGSSPLDTFIHVVLPVSRGALLSAWVMGFAHTLGEFGVVLMIGGAIPGETEVLSVALFKEVESLNYASAHTLALTLLVLSLSLLMLLYRLNPASLRGRS